MAIGNTYLKCAYRDRFAKRQNQRLRRDERPLLVRLKRLSPAHERMHEMRPIPAIVAGINIIKPNFLGELATLA